MSEFGISDEERAIPTICLQCFTKKPKPEWVVTVFGDPYCSVRCYERSLGHPEEKSTINQSPE